MTQPFPWSAWTFAISRTLRWYVDWEPPTVSGILKFGNEESMDETFLLNEDATDTATAVYLNQAGEPAPIDGDPVWAVSDEAVLALEDNGGDPFSRIVRAIGDPGQTAEVTATANTLHGRQVVAKRLVAIALPPDEAVTGQLRFGSEVVS